MGNCIDFQRPVTWADDEGWDSESDQEPESPRERKKETTTKKKTERATKEERGLYGEKGGQLLSPPTEVKITITKKQLEELLRQVDGGKLPIREVLMDVVSLKEIGLQDRGARYWRPALQSIPEASEQT